MNLQQQLYEHHHRHPISEHVLQHLYQLSTFRVLFKPDARLDPGAIIPDAGTFLPGLSTCCLFHQLAH